MKKILIVDDNQENLYFLEVLLKSKNFEVITAQNGIEALEAGKRRSPDLIITDILMPGMDGFSLCREWKKDETLSLVPFIFYTATYKDDKDEEYALSLGVDRFIKKPIEPDLFLNQILEVIADYRQTKQPARKPFIKEEDESYKLYSERLIQKLEKKMLDLEDEIKARKKFEEKLRQSRREWKEIFEAIGNPTLIMDPDFTVMQANRAATQAMKSAETELIGKKCYEIFHNTDQSQECCPLAKLKDSQQMEIGETEMEALGGTFLVSCTPVFNCDGNLEKAIHIAVDITDRKRLEKSIKENERVARERLEELENIYSYAPIGLALLNENLEYVRINQAMADINGRPISDHIGRDLKYVLPELAPTIEPIYRRVLKNGEPELNFDIRGTTRAEPGKKKDWLVNYSPLKRSDGKIEGVSTIVLDITERKKLESQLQQAQKMEALGTLAGGIAHDFNNILSSVIGYTELSLEKAQQDTLLHDNLQEVLHAGMRAKDLVKQILAFSRQTEPELQPVQVKSIVKEALKLLRASLPTTIEIRQNIESDKAVLADATQIHQILMNLCSNAGHAMREAGGILEVSLSDVELDLEFAARNPEIQPGVYQILSVSDTGHGISADEINKIFNPFYTTKQPDEGTGMGLSVVHGIVKGHGGALKVYSEPGKGTTFNVYLPIIESVIEAKVDLEEVLHRGSEHILFVDDEKPLVDIGKHILEQLGYRVTTRTSSIEALELFKVKPDEFDLVITDITMPNMTGDELARELIHIKSEIPIILCTGYNVRINPQQAAAMGIRAFVMKPVVKREIAATVRQVLDQSAEKAS